MARRRHYKKPKLPVSHRGIWSAAIAFVSAAILVVVTRLAMTLAGEVPTAFQILAFVTMAETFVGIGVGIASFKEEGTGRFLRIAGTASCIIIEVLWLIYYIVGVASI